MELVEILWDDTVLPRGTQVVITDSKGSTKRVTIRCEYALAAFFENVSSGTLTVRRGDEVVARATVDVDAVNFHSVSGEPPEDTIAEVFGSATGAMPSGGFYS